MKQTIRILTARPIVWWWILGSLIYILLGLLIAGITSTGPLFILYQDSVRWGYVLLSFALFCLIAVSATAVFLLSLVRWKNRTSHLVEGAGCVASIAGLGFGLCSICATATIPLVIGAVDVASFIGGLPGQGLEIQGIILLVLLVSAYIIRRSS